MVLSLDEMEIISIILFCPQMLYLEYLFNVILCTYTRFSSLEKLKQIIHECRIPYFPSRLLALLIFSCRPKALAKPMRVNELHLQQPGVSTLSPASKSSPPFKEALLWRSGHLMQQRAILPSDQK